MNFWIALIIMIVLCGVSITITIFAKKEQKTDDAVSYRTGSVCSAVFGILLLLLLLDVPSALKGGKTCEVSSFPPVIQMQMLSFVNTEDKTLIWCGNYHTRDKLEEDYVIHYTPITHMVMSIEEVDI